LRIHFSNVIYRRKKKKGERKGAPLASQKKETAVAQPDQKKGDKWILNRRKGDNFIQPRQEKGRRKKKANNTHKKEKKKEQFFFS